MLSGDRVSRAGPPLRSESFPGSHEQLGTRCPLSLSAVAQGTELSAQVSRADRGCFNDQCWEGTGDPSREKLQRGGADMLARLSS